MAPPQAEKRPRDLQALVLRQLDELNKLAQLVREELHGDQEEQDHSEEDQDHDQHDQHDQDEHEDEHEQGELELDLKRKEEREDEHGDQEDQVLDKFGDTYNTVLLDLRAKLLGTAMAMDAGAKSARHGLVALVRDEAALHDARKAKELGITDNARRAFRAIQNLQQRKTATGVLLTPVEQERVRLDKRRELRQEARDQIQGRAQNIFILQGRECGVFQLDQGGVCGTTKCADRVRAVAALSGITMQLSGGRRGFGRTGRLSDEFCLDSNSVVADFGCSDGAILRAFAALVKVRCVIGIDVNTAQLLVADNCMLQAASVLREMGLRLQTDVHIGAFNALQCFGWVGLTHIYMYAACPALKAAATLAVESCESLRAILFVLTKTDGFREIFDESFLTRADIDKGYGFQPQPHDAMIKLDSFQCEDENAYTTLIVPVSSERRKHCRAMLQLTNMDRPRGGPNPFLAPPPLTPWSQAFTQFKVYKAAQPVSDQ